MSPYRRNKDQLVFSNRDCIRCFGFVDRELHFIIKELSSQEHRLKFFRKEIFETKGTGNHRQLNYYEFYLVGLIKLLNNIGFTVPIAAQLIIDNVFKDFNIESPDFSNRVFSTSQFHIYSTKFSKPKLDNVVVHRGKLARNKACLFNLRVDLMQYNSLIFNYVEKYFVDQKSKRN